MSTSIELGKPVPSFTVQSTQGELSLDDFKGHFLVLYFYPKDNTPGCTTEAKDFRNYQDQFKALNAKVVGVSRDSLRSHENFIQKQELNFTLIADEDETLCQLFDVIKMKNIYGKQVRGIERSTFLIDPNGQLVAQWRGVKVSEHVNKVFQTIAELKDKYSDN